MFYPAMREPAFPTSGSALQGPGGQDASALIAGLRVGANLGGMQQNLSYPTTFHISSRLGTRDAYTDMKPGHPTLAFRGSSGLSVGNAGLSSAFLTSAHRSRKRFTPQRRFIRRRIRSEPLCRQMCKCGQTLSGYSAITPTSSRVTSVASMLDNRKRKSPSI